MTHDILSTLSGTEIFIRLIWLFVFIITVLMLILCYLFLAARRARELEAQNQAFTYLTIEGLEMERQRISRELHDIVLPLVKDQTVSGLIRSICVELASPDFSKISIRDTLIDFCVKFSERTGIKCAYSMEESLDFSLYKSENQLHIYRMIQESFNNIEKHSNAGQAVLTARHYNRGSSKSILICVSDDGKGGPVKNGLGTMNMKQRAAILGAKLDFISETGNGIMVRIKIPLPVILSR